MNDKKDLERAPSEFRSSRPLQGWRIVVTRSEDQADHFLEQLQMLGAETLVYPTIAVVPPQNIDLFDQALQRLATGGYDWLVLTSVNGVRAVTERLSVLELAETESTGRKSCLDMIHQTPGMFKVAAVGSATAATCAEMLGMYPDVVPPKFVAEALAEALGDTQGQRVLLATADIARTVLQDQLQKVGAHIDRITAYCTVPASGGVDLPRLLTEGQVDAITFTSGSTVRYFVKRIGVDMLDAVRPTVIACIGPITAEAVEKVGLTPTIVAETSTIEGLIESLIHYKESSGC